MMLMSFTRPTYCRGIRWKDEYEINGVAHGPAWWVVPDGSINLYDQPQYPGEPGWLALPTITLISEEMGLPLEVV